MLVALHDDVLSGATRAVVPAFRLLERRGWSFVIWTPRGEAARTLEDEGFRVLHAPAPLRYSWASLREPGGVRSRTRGLVENVRTFRAAISELRPDVVHANTLLTVPHAVLARSMGYRTLVHCHETPPSGFKGVVAAGLTRAAWRVVAVSEATASRLAAHGVAATVIHEGVELAPVRPAARRSGALRVGTVGTVSRRKGSDLFVEAARLISRSSPSIELRLVGSPARGSERGWAERLMAEAARVGIVVQSDIGDVRDELRTWDVFVLPSRDDPFPLAVLEAMAEGVPVVAAAVGGIPEQLSDGTGVLVRPEDAAAVADAVLALLAAPDRREAMARRARERVTRFSVERQADALEREYAQLAP